MVLYPSIPLQKFFLLQAVIMILKCPFNNFFWMTPYRWINEEMQARMNGCTIILLVSMAQMNQWTNDSADEWGYDCWRSWVNEQMMAQMNQWTNDGAGAWMKGRTEGGSNSRLHHLEWIEAMVPSWGCFHAVMIQSFCSALTFRSSVRNHLIGSVQRRL